ncbi:MAG: hypothetical protein IPL17_07255 [Anaerolineales bacterium]|nr:hypothetical protein [Anaerolineales bacterium]
MVSLFSTCGVAELEGDLGNADPIQLCAGSCGLVRPDRFLEDRMSNLQVRAVSKVTTPPIHLNQNWSALKAQTVPRLVATTNPMNYITADDAPFFIENGTADCNIPPIQNKNLADALGGVIGADKVTYTSLEGRPGGLQFEAEENVNLVIKFLDTCLGRKKNCAKIIRARIFLFIRS